MAFPWINSSKGTPSASLTLALVAFITVTGWLVTWVVGASVGLPVPAFDAGVAMSYLTPCLGLYWGRRHTDKREETKQLAAKKE